MNCIASLLLGPILLPLLPTVQQEVPAQAAEAPPQGLTIHEAGAFEGYTLYAPLQSGTTYLVDMKGNVVHQWVHGYGSTGNYLLESGHLMLISRIDDNPVFFGGGIGGRISEFAWDGTKVWEYVLSTEKRLTHHDLEVMPNGNILTIAWEHISQAEALALGRDPKQLDKHGLWPDVVLEIQPARPSGGKIVWEWRSLDHLVQDFDSEKANYAAIASQPGRIDINGDHRDTPPMTPEELEREREREQEMRELGYAGGGEDEEDEESEKQRPGGDIFHVNSVDYHAQSDLILLSTPRLNEIWVIDHSTTTEEARGSKGGRWGKGGELLYRWGNPRMYGAGKREDQKLFGQHQPEWIPAEFPGAGHVLVFNNGDKRNDGSEYSQVDEIVLPWDSKRGFDGTLPYGPKEPIWSYVAPIKEEFYSFFISGSQRLPNGNTLICSGQQGRFFEVQPDGKIVWEFWNPYGGDVPASFGGADPNKGQGGTGPVRPTSVFRATRYAPNYPGLSALKPR